MAHFYGIMQGQRGETTRLGSKKSGIYCALKTWHGALRLIVYNEDGVDKFRLTQEVDSIGSREIACGEVHNFKKTRRQQ